LVVPDAGGQAVPKGSLLLLGVKASLFFFRSMVQASMMQASMIQASMMQASMMVNVLCVV
jgi:hypothetical protein